MPFDPQVKALRDRLAELRIPNLYTLPVQEARVAEARGAVAAAGPPEKVAEVRRVSIPGPAGDLAARLYWPARTGPSGAGPAGTGPAGTGAAETEPTGNGPAGTGPWPALVYFFGGGWSLGSLDSCDGVCRRLANRAQCVTMSVEYRLAPEHKFPAAIEDCYAGTAWLAAHAAELGVDPARLAVGGDSSGGNLAAAVALLSRERGVPAIVHQLLVYPNVDYMADTPSMREIDDPHFLSWKATEWYWSLYLATPGDGSSPLASPLRAADLCGLPAATIILAEYDPLRDEGHLYGDRLRDAGVATEVTQYDGMMHGFFTMTGLLDGSRQAVAHAARCLRAAFAREATE